jgi:hypothetical protein
MNRISTPSLSVQRLFNQPLLCQPDCEHAADVVNFHRGFSVWLTNPCRWPKNRISDNPIRHRSCFGSKLRAVRNVN